MNVLSLLKWRYATKRMNGQKVPDEKLETILEAIRLAPTSIGLQPFTVLIVESKQLKEKISPAIYNQPQITEGSHVLIFAAWKNISEENIEKYLHSIATLRAVSIDSLEGLNNMIHGAIEGKTQEQILNWNSRQAYIALGTGLLAAAEMEVDATPMEGFDADALDAALDLNQKGLRSTVVMALGYRDAEKDYLANAAKVRRNSDDLFVRL